MKKTLFVAALAAVMVFAFASVAMASSFTLPSASAWYSGAAAAPTGAGSGLYNAWSNGTYGSTEVTTGAFGDLAANGGASSPHGGYTTTTIKCATCHSTHGAAVGQEVLLRAGGDLRAANGEPNACVFCHVNSTTGIGLEGMMVYTGSGLDVVGGPSSNGYHSPQVNCKRCHGSVHGKDVLDATQFPVLASKLLRDAGSSYKSTTAIGKATLTANGFNGANVSDITSTSDSRYWSLIGAWCSACHAGSFTSQGNMAANLDANSATKPMTGHRLNALDTTNWTPTGYEQYSHIQVAWKPVANNCQNCHDATNAQGHAGFPHFAPNATAFLGGAIDASAAVTPVGDETVEEAQLQDGVCLKCHNSSGTGGVSKSF